MNVSSDIYYTLLASLPAMPTDYRQPHTPISWLRLEGRLAILDKDTRKLVNSLFSLMNFDTSEAGRIDRKNQELYRQLTETMTDSQQRELLDLLIDTRDIVAALRARRQQQPPPPMLGNYAVHIKWNWHQADFRLGLRFPWINPVRHFLDNDQISKAEDRIFHALWQEVRRHGERHHFSLPALIAYLLQWHLVSTWSARDEKRSRQRFTKLLEEAVNGYDALFA